jgi:hypothetical protein
VHGAFDTLSINTEFLRNKSPTFHLPLVTSEYGRQLCCTCASVTRRTLCLCLLLELTCFMILRSIAILLMSPLNIIQQRYIYWNDLTVCIVSLYNLLLCILLLYNHCNDFAPCGILIIGIKNILSYLILYKEPASTLRSQFSPHFLSYFNINGLFA